MCFILKNRKLIEYMEVILVNNNNAVKAIPAIAGAGITLAGTISAPVLLAGAIGLVAIGGLCVLAGESKEGTLKVNRNGLEGNFKK